MSSEPGPERDDLFYRRHVFCCTNVRDAADARGCCDARGGTWLRNYMKTKAKKMGLGDVRINASGCLDRCELGPTMVIYPDGVWYSCKTRDDVDEVLQAHLVEGRIVERLRLPGRAPA